MGYQLIMVHGRPRPQAVAISGSIKSAESWGLPALTRRRDHMHAAHRGARVI
jgi:hypothetical protein